MMDTPVVLSDVDSILKYFKRSQVKWFDAGLKLGLDHDTLEAIQKSHGNNKSECIVKMIKQLVKEPHPPTMRGVLKVLKLKPSRPPIAVKSALSDPQHSSASPPKCSTSDQSDFMTLPSRSRSHSPEPPSPSPKVYRNVCQFASYDPNRSETEIKLETEHILSLLAGYVPNHNPASGLPVYTDPPTDEQQQLIVSLQEQTLAIRKKFDELVTAIMGFEVPHDFFKLKKQSSSVDVFRAAATGHWSFYNYDNLKKMRAIIGDEILGILEQEYVEHFSEYCKRRLRKFPSDGAAVEEKVVFLMDNKMGLQRSAKLELRQLQSQVSEVTGFRVSKLVWIEDDWQEPTLKAELSDKGGSARELDSAPTLPQPREPCPPLQRYLPNSKK